MAEYSRAEAERLVRFCRDAETAISAELIDLIERSQRGEIIGPQDDAVVKIDQILQEFLEGCRQWVEQAISASYLAGMQNIRREDEKPISALHEKAANAIAASTFSRLLDVYKTMKRWADDKVLDLNLKNIQNQIAVEAAARKQREWVK
jgi:hypothetical protein